MKKQVLALLASVAACAAHAQSNVTIFGSLDLNVTYSKVGSQHATGMDQGGYLLPSRIGFRGTEDLGGGWSTGFWLESAVLPDTGASQGAFFGRRSTVSLTSKTWGEVRLGRDYTPTFWNVSHFTPLGTVGVGGSSNIIEGWPLGLGAARTQSRASNAVGYFLPRTLGGVYGQVMIAAGEKVEGARYEGGRIGYAAGPVNIAVAYGQTRMGIEDYKTATVGGTYDFGVVKAYVNYLQHRLGSDKQTNILIGAAVPVGGAGSIKASFARSNRSGSDADAQQLAIGYTYALSKRTTLYTAYSHIRNDGNAAYVTAPDLPPAGVPGRKAQGFQVGINQAF
jgi:predicted porin